MKNFQKLLDKLNRRASQNCADDWPDYCPADNENFDDAYSDGFRSGETQFARELLEFLGQPLPPREEW